MAYTVTTRGGLVIVIKDGDAEATVCRPVTSNLWQGNTEKMPREAVFPKVP